MFAIRQAVEKGDGDELARWAFTLKNLAGMLCGWRVWEAASGLEKMGQAGRPALKDYHALEETVGNFEKCLKDWQLHVDKTLEQSTK
jgi:hypothetical protein